MTEEVPKFVSDKLGKEWSCHLEVDNGTLIVHVQGYTKQYPLICILLPNQSLPK